MTTGRINQNATCFCLLSQEHQRRGGGGSRSWAEKPHAPLLLLLLLARGRTNAQIQGFSRHRTNPQHQPIAAKRELRGRGRTAEERRERRKEETSPILSLPLLEYHVLNDTRSTRAHPYRDQSSLTRWDANGRNTQTPQHVDRR